MFATDNSLPTTIAINAVVIIETLSPEVWTAPIRLLKAVVERLPIFPETQKKGNFDETENLKTCTAD